MPTGIGIALAPGRVCQISLNSCRFQAVVMAVVVATAKYNELWEQGTDYADNSQTPKN